MSGRFRHSRLICEQVPFSGSFRGFEGRLRVGTPLAAGSSELGGGEGLRGTAVREGSIGPRGGGDL